MKVLQINAVYGTKSTGRIVMEIHNFLRSKHIDCYVAYATECIDDCKDDSIFKVGNIIDHKLHAILYRIDNLQGCHSTYYTKKLLKRINDIKPDIAIMHNLHSNYLNIPLLFKELTELGISIVICLHDCWFMTGGCYHYTV